MLIKKTEQLGSTPLHLVCKFARIEMAELLVNHSPDLINIKDNDDWTPRHCAFYAAEKNNVLIDFL